MWQVVFAQSTHVVTVPRGLVCVVIPAMCCSHIFQVSSKFVLGFWSRRESKFGHSHYFGYWQRACTAAQALMSRMLPSCCTDWSVIVDAQLIGLEGRSAAETRAMLQGIVRHYQTLFDVPNVLGVYASMSVIYRKLSEAHTILTTLKDHLDLGKSC